MNGELTVSVVIPTHNRSALVERAVRALLAEDAVTEIVVVDDHSTDDTPTTLAALAADDPRVRPIRSTGSGSSRARQAGLEAARGDVVLFIDDDVVAAPALAAGHARHHEAVERLVVVGYMPTIAPAERTVDTVPVHIYASDYEAQIRRYEADPTTVLLDLWGGNISMRRADRLAIGMHGSRVFQYHEDKDLGLRCREAGMDGVFDRSLRAEHHPIRPFSSFLRVARAQGRDLVGVHQEHADVLGPLDASAMAAGLPRAARLALAAGTLPVLGAAELRFLQLCLRGLAIVRWRRAQNGVAVLARTIAKGQGIRDAERASTPGPAAS